MTTHYEILGIKKNASQQEITTAYRQLAKQWHPDKNTAPEATEQFQKISNAHDVLKDPEQRKRYDDELNSVQSSQATHTHVNPPENLNLKLFFGFYQSHQQAKTDEDKNTVLQNARKKLGEIGVHDVITKIRFDCPACPKETVDEPYRHITMGWIINEVMSLDELTDYMQNEHICGNDTFHYHFQLAIIKHNKYHFLLDERWDIARIRYYLPHYSTLTLAKIFDVAPLAVVLKLLNLQIQYDKRNFFYRNIIKEPLISSTDFFLELYFDTVNAQKFKHFSGKTYIAPTLKFINERDKFFRITRFILESPEYKSLNGLIAFYEEFIRNILGKWHEAKNFVTSMMYEKLEKQIDISDTFIPYKYCILGWEETYRLARIESYEKLKSFMFEALTSTIGGLEPLVDHHRAKLIEIEAMYRALSDCKVNAWAVKKYQEKIKDLRDEFKNYATESELQEKTFTISESKTPNIASSFVGVARITLFGKSTLKEEYENKAEDQPPNGLTESKLAR